MQSILVKFYIWKIYLRQKFFNRFNKDILEHRAYFAYEDTLKKKQIPKNLNDLKQGVYNRYRVNWGWVYDKESIKKYLQKNGKLPEVYFADDEFYQAVGNNVIRKHPDLDQETDIKWEEYTVLYHYKKLEDMDL